MSNASWMYQPAPLAPSDDAAGRLSPTDDSSQTRHNPTSSKDAHSSATRIRRRNRVIASCLECRRRKLKCDKTAPCGNCARFRRDCLYLAPSLDAHSQQKLAEIKERMGTLEKTLERDVAKKPSLKSSGPGSVAKGSSMSSEIKDESSEEDGEEGEDELGFLVPTPLVSHDHVYQQEDDADDELMDLGVQMGKMRITERVGGWVRPKIVEELSDTLKEVQGDTPGVPYPGMSQSSDPREGNGSTQRIRATPKGYLGPGPDYIAPASSFYFPGTNVQTSLLDYLPSRVASDHLINQYWAAVHYLCRCVHRPTFEAQYNTFWDRITAGTEPTASIQAIIFAAMFSAAVSMTGDQVLQQFGATKAALMDSLRSGTEMALAKANFLRTTRVDTIQAFVMYLIPLCRAEVSRAHSALTGTAIRLAECIGMHRDGSHYGLTPVEIHVRRMVWYQLCFLDLRTAMATGPRPSIRQDEFDTRLPLNVNDVDLLKPNPPTEDSPHFTDMTCSLIRMHCAEMNRSLNGDIAAIDRRKKSLQQVLVKIQKFRARTTEKFEPLLDRTIPFHDCAAQILQMYLEGYYIQALHRYLFSAAQKMPDRLRQILLEAGTLHMEAAIHIDTLPALRPWAWYRGALNQYHSSLLLMVEVYAFPMRKEAPRIWKSLDYIFDIPAHLPPKAKAELVLTDLRDRMEQYAKARRVRASTEQEQRIGSLGKKFTLSAVFRARALEAGAQGGELVGEEMAGPGEAMGEGVDLVSQLAEQVPIAGAMPAGPLPPINFNFNSPIGNVPVADGDGGGGGGSGGVGGNTDASSGAMQSGSTPNGDTQMGGLMEDIDWAEWDKYFSPDTNTGDLNIPDFDYSQFTQGYDYLANIDNANTNYDTSANTSTNTDYNAAPNNHDPLAFDASTASFPDPNVQSNNFGTGMAGYGGGAQHNIAKAGAQNNGASSGAAQQQDLADVHFTPAYFAQVPVGYGKGRQGK